MIWTTARTMRTIVREHTRCRRLFSRCNIAASVDQMHLLRRRIAAGPVARHCLTRSSCSIDAAADFAGHPLAGLLRRANRRGVAHVAVGSVRASKDCELWINAVDHLDVRPHLRNDPIANLPDDWPRGQMTRDELHAAAGCSRQPFRSRHEGTRNQGVRHDRDPAESDTLPEQCSLEHNGVIRRADRLLPALACRLMGKVFVDPIRRRPSVG